MAPGCRWLVMPNLDIGHASGFLVKTRQQPRPGWVDQGGWRAHDSGARGFLSGRCVLPMDDGWMDAWEEEGRVVQIRSHTHE